MTIGKKIFLIFIFGYVFIIGFYTLFNHLNIEKQVSDEIKTKISSIKSIIQDEFSRKKSLISAKSLIISTDKDINNEFIKGNNYNSILLNYFLAESSAYIEATDKSKEHYFLLDREKNVVANFSNVLIDKINNMYTKNALLGKIREGITTDENGEIVISSARPISVDEKIKGVSYVKRFVEKSLLLEIKKRTNLILIIIKKSGSYISSEDIKETKDLDSFFNSLMKKGDTFDENSIPIIDFKINEDSLELTYFPIKDTYTNEILGFVLSGFSVKPYIEQKSINITMNLVIGFIIIIIMTFFTIFITKGITKPIKEISNIFNSISKGEADLRYRFSVNKKSKNEINALKEHFNLFVDKIQEIILNIKTVSEKLIEMTGSIRKYTRDAYQDIEKNQQSFLNIVKETESQVETTTETNTNIINMLSSLNEITNNVENQRNQVESVLEQNVEIENSTKSVNDIVENLNNLSTELKRVTNEGLNNTNKVIEIILRLNELSKQVIASTSVISAMNENINVLAMNASIESVKSQASGFTVISQEIRKLSTESHKNGNIIIETVNNIDTEIKNAVMLSNNFSEELKKIINSINENDKKITELSNITKYQSIKTTEILSSITELRKISNLIENEIKRQQFMNNNIAKSLNKINDSIIDISNSMKLQEKTNENVVLRTENLGEIIEESSVMIIKMKALIGRFKL